MFISVLFIPICYGSKYFLNERKIVSLLLVFCALGYLSGKILTYLNISGYDIYFERRIIFVCGNICFSIISAYALYHFISYCSNKNSLKRFGAVFLGLLILIGSGSTFLYVNYWTNKGIGTYDLSSDEVEAMEFLKTITNSSSVVLAYDLESNIKLGLTGAITLGKYWLPFRSVSPSIPRSYLTMIDYIYLTTQDYIQLQESQNSYMKSLINSLPVLYHNPKVMILQVPQVFKFNNNLSVPVITYSDISRNLSPLLMLDYLDLSYKIYEGWDNEVLQQQKLAILLGDVEGKFESENYLNWIQNGGHLIVFGTNSGYFSNLMGIEKSLRNATANSVSWGNDIVITYSNFDISTTKSRDGEVQPLCWYTFNKSKITPFIYSKKIGEGSLSYIVFELPIRGVSFFNSYKRSFLSLIEPSLQNFLNNNKVKDIPYWIVFVGNISLKGEIEVTSNVMLVQSSNEGFDCLLKYTNGTTSFITVENMILNTPHKFINSINGSLFLNAYHDEYEEMSITNSSYTTILLQENDETYEEAHMYINGKDVKINELKEIIINLNRSMRFYVKSPEISIKGLANLQNCYIDYPFSEIIRKTHGGTAILKGLAQLNVLISDKNGEITVCDYLSFKGDIDYTYPNILNIEFPIIDSSFFSINSFLLIIIFIGVYLYASIFFVSETNI
jgi:hypothetical protein